MKPYIHAQISAKKFGGVPEDYFEIHDFMDCSKGAFPTNAHRALTHNAWFIKEVLERVKFTNSCEPIGNSFPNILNSDGRKVSVRDIGEQHILDDFSNRFIPSAQDYLEHLKYQDWMGNGKGTPSSFQNTKMPSTRGSLNSENQTTYDGSLEKLKKDIDESLEKRRKENLQIDKEKIQQPPFTIPRNPIPFPNQIRD